MTDRLALTLVCALAATGCGLKGDLYIPDEVGPSEVPATATPGDADDSSNVNSDSDEEN